MTLLEEFVAQINSSVFFREFAISSSIAELGGGGKVEIADHLVLLGPHVLAFQMKERDPSAPHGLAEVNAWFRNKVRKRAVSQMRNTLSLLRDHAGAPLRNDRGHVVNVPDPCPEVVPALVVYRVEEPEGFEASKGYESRRAGFVHFMSARDYFNICDLFVTPTEVIDYLAFRRRLIEVYPRQVHQVGEAAIAGQFLVEADGPPAERYRSVLSAMRDARDEWDIGFLTDRLGEQVVYRAGTDQSETSHYRILAELAQLSRSELRALKERLRLALEAVREERFARPYRFAVPRTDCGFMVFSAMPEMHEHLEAGLGNLSVGSKYEFGTTKHVGLAVAKREGYIDLLWLFLEAPHFYNAEVEQLLRDSNPFRTVSERVIPRYHFDSEALSWLASETGASDSG
jgi:hypothetical protein